MDEALVVRYAAHVHEVPGWLDMVDYHLLAETGRLQAARGVAGDILEIGVFHGRSAILLGALLAPGERLLACDTFGSDAVASDANAAESTTYYPTLRRTDFEEQYLRFHPELPEILAVDSADLGSLVPSGSCRIAHVDGGHTYDVVRRDITLVRGLLRPDGVGVFDDVSKRHLPGTAVAIWEEVLRNGLVPAALTDGKLYASWDAPAADALMRALTRWAETLEDGRVEHHEIAGHTVARIVPRKLRPPVY